jgi:hypothetical protein
MVDFLIYGEPVKGWTLVRAIRDVSNMKAGEWGLAFTNLFFTKKNFYPSFVFKDLPDDLADYGDFDSYMVKIDEFEECMRVDPQVGYAFYTASIDDGFNPSLDDFYIFTAERLMSTAIEGQKKLSKKQLRILMEIFVSKEEYEKAALVRDTLDKKQVDKFF